MKINLFLMMVSMLTANAQFNKGRMLVAGEFSFTSQTNKSKSGSTTTTNYKTTTVGFTPAMGYFFIDNLAAGLAMNVSASKLKYENSGQQGTTSSFSIGPFVRYYLPPGIFFQGIAGFGTSKTHFDLPAPMEDVDLKYGRMNWDLGAGYVYFLNDYVALEPIVGYQSSTSTDKDNDDKSINGGLYINAALTIYLGERN